MLLLGIREASLWVSGPGNDYTQRAWPCSLIGHPMLVFSPEGTTPELEASQCRICPQGLPLHPSSDDNRSPLQLERRRHKAETGESPGTEVKAPLSPTYQAWSELSLAPSPEATPQLWSKEPISYLCCPLPSSQGKGLRVLGGEPQ